MHPEANKSAGKTLVNLALRIFFTLVPLSAYCQTISVQVKNDHGHTVNLSSNTCNNSTCTPTPPSSVPIGATSTPFGAVPGSGQSSPLITTKWTATVGATHYGCQFQAGATIGVTSCSKTISGNAYEGVFPNPGCKVTGLSQAAYPACGLTVMFDMTPSSQ